MSIVVVYILYSMYNNNSNNNNDNKCDAIVYTICAYVHTVRHLCQPTHAQTGWLDRAREDSVQHIMRHIAHHSITHTYTYTYIYYNIYTTYIHTTIVGNGGRGVCM